MSEPEQLHMANIYLPPEVTVAIAAIPDVPSALGELRCLTGALFSALDAKHRSNDFTRFDAVVEAMLAVVSRMADDNPIALQGAICAADCACHEDSGRSSVKHALVDAFKRVAQMAPASPAPEPEPGRGMYL